MAAQDPFLLVRNPPTDRLDKHSRTVTPLRVPAACHQKHQMALSQQCHIHFYSETGDWGGEGGRQTPQRPPVHVVRMIKAVVRMVFFVFLFIFPEVGLASVLSLLLVQF